MVWHVDPSKCNQLNLRKAPKTGAVIATLPQGSNVDKVSAHPTEPAWWSVNVTLNGQTVTGYVHSGYLASGPGNTIPLAISTNIPEVHLNKAGHRRVDGHGQANPLDDAAMPTRGTGSAATKAANILTIIQYLDTDRAAHKRYWPTGTKTFCNIYAYDFAQRCGTYVPRVWWTPAALLKIAAGTIPPVLYGNTVREMTANMLHDWFIDYGAIYGWSRVFDTDALQAAANNGQAAIIVAKRVNVAKSGHIVAVVPETTAIQAARSGGVVVRPVQSQAGADNFMAEVPGTRWWANASSFQSFGFWIHA